METDNLGISIYSTSIIKDDVSSLYVALTGDQCALTNIRIAQEAGDDPFEPQDSEQSEQRIILFSPQAIACGLSALCLYTGFHDH